MEAIIPDDHSLEIFRQLEDVTTILDENGRVMGYFTPKAMLPPQEPSQENTPKTTDDK